MDRYINERRFDIYETMVRRKGGLAAAGGPTITNPLVKHFENDRVVMELEVDNEARVSIEMGAVIAGAANMLLFPFCWPVIVIHCIVGTPFNYFYCGGKDRQNIIANAHKLVLREESIHYVVEPHRQEDVWKPLCCSCCCGPGPSIDRIEEVYPISMVSWAGMETNESSRDLIYTDHCGAVVGELAGKETYTVKLNGSSLPSVAIDAPTGGGGDFSSALEEKKKVILDRFGGVPGGDLPPGVRQDFHNYLLTTSAFTPLTTWAALCYEPSAGGIDFGSHAERMVGLIQDQEIQAMHQRQAQQAQGQVQAQAQTQAHVYAPIPTGVGAFPPEAPVVGTMVRLGGGDGIETAAEAGVEVDGGTT